MIFSVDYLVWHISQFMVLYPGDVIHTGTPAGLALGRPDPKPYVRHGTVVACEIDGHGLPRNVLRSARGRERP
jgi:2-keto-4-pentenoate hydratase/2-oxohepta-3-ene-1,7-dioic acid hydratase in catechol pathway